MSENVGYATMSIIPSFRGFEAAARRELSGKLDGVGRQTGEQFGRETSDGFGRSIGGMTRYAKAAAVGVGVALGAGAVAVGKWGLGIASANEQAQISFETMLGSADKATAFLEDLKAFAAETPFEFPELQTAASSLISAGIEAGKVIPIMTTLGDVTSGMGTGSEGIKRATVALQQMQAAGKITGEDLNQLRDAGIPVYDLLAAASGKAKTEVAALAQAGKLGKTELEQLMGALESGAGLERFNGLMDKQSESLAGLGSTLMDNLGQGLATQLEPTVGLLKDALPTITDLANDGLALLGDGLERSIEAGQGFAAWITPIASDIGDHLVPVLEDLQKIAGTTLPRGFEMLGGGIVAVQHILNPFLDLIHEGTSFLADHNEIVLAGVAAYAAWKAVDFGASFLGADKITKATAAMRGFITTTHALAATQGITMGQAAITNLMTTTVSGATVAGGALAGLAGGAAIAFATIKRGADQGHAAAKEFLESLHIDSTSSDSMQSGVAKLNDEIQALSAEAGRGGWTAAWQEVNPFDENTVDKAQAKQRDLSKALGEFTRDLQKTYGAASLLGTSADTIDAWVEKLDLDVDQLGPKRLAWAIGDARNAAESGTPVTDKLREAYKTLADETSSSTDKIDAWKGALDAALDNPQSLFDATTAYAEGLESFRKTLTEGGWGGFGTDTEAGRNNRDALSGLVDNVQDLAHAYADMGQNDKAAETIRQGREQIVEAGKAAGFSEQQVQDYLDSLGLTEGTWRAQVELAGDGEAQAKLDALQAKLNILSGNLTVAQVRVEIDTIMNNTPAGQTTTVGPIVLPGKAQLHGGIDNYAAGGRRESMIGSGRNIVWWDEPETGGEAFFPRLGAGPDRDKNMEIVAGWYDGLYLSSKDMAAKKSGGAGSSSRSSGNNLTGWHFDGRNWFDPSGQYQGWSEYEDSPIHWQGAAPAGYTPNPGYGAPKPRQQASFGGRRRVSKDRPITINTNGPSTRAIADELLWVS